jgi:hypothetical protein
VAVIWPGAVSSGYSGCGWCARNGTPHRDRLVIKSGMSTDAAVGPHTARLALRIAAYTSSTTSGSPGCSSILSTGLDHLLKRGAGMRKPSLQRLARFFTPL